MEKNFNEQYQEALKAQQDLLKKQLELLNNPEYAEQFNQNMAKSQELMSQWVDNMSSDNFDDFIGEMLDYEVIRSEDSDITADQKHLLALGAPINIFNSDYTDTIRSIYDQDSIREMLEEEWGVNNEQSAKETIEWLFEEGQHQDGDAAISEIIEKGINAISATELYDEDSKIGDVIVVLKHMIENGHCTEENFPKTIIAWDLVRVVSMARWTYYCNYITLEELWKSIKQAMIIAKQTFKTWEELGISFAFGRGVWQGDTYEYDYAYEVIEFLLESEDSPWNIEFK